MFFNKLSVDHPGPLKIVRGLILGHVNRSQ